MVDAAQDLQTKYAQREAEIKAFEGSWNQSRRESQGAQYGVQLTQFNKRIITKYPELQGYTAQHKGTGGFNPTTGLSQANQDAYNKQLLNDPNLTPKEFINTVQPSPSFTRPTTTPKQKEKKYNLTYKSLDLTKPYTPPPTSQNMNNPTGLYALPGWRRTDNLNNLRTTSTSSNGLFAYASPTKASTTLGGILGAEQKAPYMQEAKEADIGYIALATGLPRATIEQNYAQYAGNLGKYSYVSRTKEGLTAAEKTGKGYLPVQSADIEINSPYSLGYKFGASTNSLTSNSKRKDRLDNFRTVQEFKSNKEPTIFDAVEAAIAANVGEPQQDIGQFRITLPEGKQDTAISKTSNAISNNALTAGISGYLTGGFGGAISGFSSAKSAPELFNNFDLTRDRMVWTSNTAEIDAKTNFNYKLTGLLGSATFTKSVNPFFDPRAIREREAERQYNDYQESKSIIQNRQSKGVVLEQIGFFFEDLPKSASRLASPFVGNAKDTLRQQQFVIPATISDTYGSESKNIIKQAGRGFDYTVAQVVMVAGMQVAFSALPVIAGDVATKFAPAGASVPTPFGTVITGGKAAASYNAAQFTTKTLGLATSLGSGYMSGWETVAGGKKEFNWARAATGALALPIAIREITKVQRGEGADIWINRGQLPTGEKYSSFSVVGKPLATYSQGRLTLGGKVNVNADATRITNILASVGTKDYKLGSQGKVQYAVEKQSYANWIDKNKGVADFKNSNAFTNKLTKLENVYDTAFKKENILDPQYSFSQRVQANEFLSPEQKTVAVKWAKDNRGFIEFYYGGQARASWGLGESNDFDILGKKGIEPKISDLYKNLKSAPGAEIRMPDPKGSPGLIEVAVEKGKFAHMFDIHYPGMPSPTAQQPSQFILGRYNKPFAFRGTADSIQIIQSGSEMRQLVEANAIFTGLGASGVATAFTRYKDSANFYILGVATGQPAARLDTIVKNTDTSTLKGAIARFTEKGIAVPNVFSQAYASTLLTSTPKPTSGITNLVSSPFMFGSPSMSYGIFSATSKTSPSISTKQSPSSFAISSLSPYASPSKTSPYASPSKYMSKSPIISPSLSPSISPSISPSLSPYASPSKYMSKSPSPSPSISPSPSPSPYPYSYTTPPPPSPPGIGLPGGFTGAAIPSRRNIMKMPKQKAVYRASLFASLTGLRGSINKNLAQTNIAIRPIRAAKKVKPTKTQRIASNLFSGGKTTGGLKFNMGKSMNLGSIKKPKGKSKSLGFNIKRFF